MAIIVNKRIIEIKLYKHSNIKLEFMTIFSQSIVTRALIYLINLNKKSVAPIIVKPFSSLVSNIGLFITIIF